MSAWQLWFVTFRIKKIGSKAAYKMLVKLPPEVNAQMLPEKVFLQRSQVMKIETAIKEPEIQFFSI